MAVTDATKRLVGIKSGNRCAKPDCNRALAVPATGLDLSAITGQIAHIAAQADNGPRADPHMLLADRDAEPNLLLLCRDHHAIADAQENTYTVLELTEWKTSHEAAVEQQMNALAPDITFIELELVADAVVSAPVQATPGFHVTEVRQKMSKNDLTDRVTPDMARGMLGVPVVKEYIAERANMAPDFPDRLRGGFVAEYERLSCEGLRGDALFFALRVFAAPSHLSLERQMAGVAVLVHLFRICQVFEP
jgi:hypothetical protein